MYAHQAPTQRVEVAPGFFVTPDGAVYQKTIHGVVPRNIFYLDGYPTVSVKIDGKWRSRGVHQLVMHAFGPAKPSPMHIIRHLDGDPANPRIGNLAWGTNGDNRADDQRHGKTNTFRRQGKTYSAQVYLSEEQLRVVIAVATREDLPVSAFIRNCVMNYIAGARSAQGDE